MPKRLIGRKAWLITWDWSGGHAAVPEQDKIAGILKPQTGPDAVKRVVELLYAAREFAAIDKLAALTHNPYPARFDTIKFELRSQSGEVLAQNVPYAGRIVCGHNPFLYARLVVNLRPKDINDPGAGLMWNELPLPSGPRET